MNLTMLKAKIHQARVTQVEREYEGSCAIDDNLLRQSGIQEYEQIHIYNIDNGERFITYAIRGEPGSGLISINGAAAHKASRGDRVIICTYATMPQEKTYSFKPSVLQLDEYNRVTAQRNAIPMQKAS